MPELPEVETIRRGLTRYLLGKKIVSVSVGVDKIVRGDTADFVSTLVGNSFVSIERRGKLLMFFLKQQDKVLLVHLKMTGQLIYQRGEEVVAGGHSWPSVDDALPNKYSHVVIDFAGGVRLFFNDMRQFGYMQIVPVGDIAGIVAGYGIEPLTPDFTWEAFERALSGRSTNVKALLLNQTVIAGLGNIYVDEACFRAKVLPHKRVNRLTKAQKRALFDVIPQVLESALLHGGTTFSAYRDADGAHGNFTQLLDVYGRVGESCNRCQATLLKTKIAGRGTVYCAQCQH